MQVLLADDHPLFADALAELLSADLPGSEITMVASFPAALEALGAKAFDLIILDVDMPGSSGIDSLRFVLDKRQGAAVAVVSGVMDMAAAVHAIELGAKGFLPKTMPPKAISEALRVVAAGGTYAPAEFLSALMAARQQAKDNAALLSAREQQAIELLAEGKSNKEIGAVLGLQEITIKLYLRNAYRKLGARNRVEAVTAATARGLVRPRPAPS